MGYSYTAKAGYTLDHLAKLLRNNEPGASGAGAGSNGIMRINGFWEHGREQGDGAITGTVWKEAEPGSDMVRRMGSFRINPDGTIERFPGSTKAERKYAEEMGRAEYHEIHVAPRAALKYTFTVFESSGT